MTPSLWAIFILGFASECICNSCRTPTDKEGVCIKVTSCESAVQLLRQSTNNPNVVNYLRRSYCGRVGSSPLVCCPNVNNGTTSDDDGVSRSGLTSSGYPLPEKCGISVMIEDKITDGYESQLGALPWIVVYGYKNRLVKHLLWSCGGSLISDKHTITAAHCIKKELTVVRLGELNLDPNVEDGANPLDIHIKSAIIHNDYNPTDPNVLNDIAIVVLKSPVTFTNLISPICLPQASDLRNSDFKSKLATVAGWGRLKFKGPGTKALLEAGVRIISHNACQEIYSDTSKGNKTISPNQICAGGGTQDACSGDSGGPLMVIKHPNVYLVGIVSYGIECGIEGYPGIYTRVTSYIDWIRKNLT